MSKVKRTPPPINKARRVKDAIAVEEDQGQEVIQRAPATPKPAGRKL